MFNVYFWLRVLGIATMMLGFFGFMAEVPETSPLASQFQLWGLALGVGFVGWVVFKLGGGSFSD